MQFNHPARTLVLVWAALLLLFTTTTMTQMTALPIRLVTFNIRYAATSLDHAERPWAERAPLVVGLLRDAAAAAAARDPPAETVIGLQEVLRAQLDDVKAGLGPEWAHLGVGRDDGADAGEFNPLLYRPAALRMLSNRTRWLSPTPDVPSFGWGAGSRRMINAAVFEHLASGRQFVAANTHLDNASREARARGVMVALDVIRAVQAQWGPLAVSLTGDFNSEPDADAYSALAATGYMEELYNVTQESQRHGDYDTFTGFDPDREQEEGKRIDFIWLGPKEENRWQVDRYEVLSNVKDGVYLSDHRAVIGDVQILF